MSLLIIQDCLWLCSDCTQVACNGSRGMDLGAKEVKRIEDGLVALSAGHGWAHLVPNFDSETGDGIRECSDRICECCKSSLAGYRAKFALLNREA